MTTCKLCKTEVEWYRVDPMEEDTRQLCNACLIKCMAWRQCEWCKKDFHPNTLLIGYCISSECRKHCRVSGHYSRASIDS